MTALRATLALLLASCAATPLHWETLKPAGQADAPRIVIIKSSSNPRFAEPIPGFIANVDGEVSSITLAETGALDDEAHAVAERRPSLIVTIGARAAIFGSKRFPSVPNIALMVINHKDVAFDPHSHTSGIAIETSAQQAFAQFKIVAPNLKRVLALHSSKTKADLDVAAKALEALGIELVRVEVSSADEVEKRFAEQRGRVDAVWMPTDPVVMQRQVFASLSRLAVEAKLPLLASLSRDLAEQGALMAVAVDLRSLGAQAAALARTLLAGGKAQGFIAPIGARLVVNLDTARRINMNIPEEILPLLDLVGGELAQERRK